MDVIGIGSPVLDCLSLTERIPRTNELVRMLDYSWQGGGKVATALVALSRLGAKTGMIATVGDDAFGSYVVNDFKWNGVDTSHIVLDKDETTTFAIAIAELQTSGRSFIARDGTCRDLTLDDLDEEYIACAKYIHLTDMTPITIEAARLARKHGVKVAFDADLYARETVENLELIDVFIASEYFYKGMFNKGAYDENCAQIRKCGPDVVAVTLGPNGSIGLDQGGYTRSPAFTNINVVDTTGAGDVYHGAFIYGLLQRWALGEIMRFSTAVATIKCTRLGGRAGVADFATVRKYLESGTIDYTEIDERVKRYKKGFFRD